MKKSTFFFVCFMAVQISFSQSVGIGTATPAASAKLDVSSTTQGMLVPRMTTTQRTAISSPASGLLVYDLTTNSFWFKGGTTWVELIDSVTTEVHRNGPNSIYTGMTDNVGIGVLVPTNKIDINDGSVRTGTHATNRPLYVTGNMGPNNGIEFRHYNGTQGIGFGYNTIYATGSDADQNLGIQAKGAAGNLLFSANGNERMRITGNGNVGIGTTAPNAPLQFASVQASRKIVLFENANNDNQFFGFGINSSALRYQAQGDHVFYFGVNSTTSNELMRITSSGKVGIGVSSPNATLSIVRGTAPNGSLEIGGTNYNSHFNYGTPEDTYIRGGKAGAKVIINDLVDQGNVGIGTTNPLQKLHVGGKLAVDNNVGIGNTDPHAPLQFSSDLQNRKIVLYEGTNNDHQYYGFGVNGSILRYQVSNPGDNHVFYAGASASSSNELMRIMGIGQVGIGVSSPNAMLEIARGTAPNGSLQVNGTSYNSYFNNSAAEDTYIRGGKPGAKVIINDVWDQGNVGIGTATPLQKLHVGGNIAVDDSVGIGITTPLQKLHVIGNVAVSDKVGIGNTDPHAPLQFANSTANRKIVLWENGNNDHQFYGLGINSNIMRYQTSDTGSDHVFYAGTSATTSNELMRIKGNGDVNIPGKLKIGYQRISSGVSTISGLSYGISTCQCPAGSVAVGGGYESNGFPAHVIKNYPLNDMTWYVGLYNTDLGDISLISYVICARLAN